MTPADLRARLEPLLGPLWQSRLARALELNVRTVRRMIECDRVPAYVEAVVELLETTELYHGKFVDLEAVLPDRWQPKTRGPAAESGQ